MRFSRSATVAALAASLVLAANAPVAAQTTSPTRNSGHLAKLAPADEYFGPLRLSIIGIRNSLAQTTLRLESAGFDDGDAFRSVSLVEASVRAWETKYPKDAWLPRTVLALHRVYRRMASESASLHAVDVAAWLLQKYPDSDEAHSLRAELAAPLGPDGETAVSANTQ